MRREVVTEFRVEGFAGQSLAERFVHYTYVWK